MSVITKSAFDSSKFKHKIKSGPTFSNSSKGPIKASYELPNRRWQMKYQYNSPSKTVQNGSKSSRKLAEESSEYGTMENPDTGSVPLLNIEDNSCFNDVTINERRERIGAILEEILSIPRLAEANITQRSLSRSSMARFTGGGSVRSGSSQMSGNINNGSRQSNFSRYPPQERKSVLVRSVSSPKISVISNKDYTKSTKKIDKKPVNSNLSRRSAISRSTSNINKSQQKTSEVPKLNLALNVTSRSQPQDIRGLSAEFLPAHNTSALRPKLGNDTQAELAIPTPSPTIPDHTITLNDESDTFEVDRSTDFVRANMRVSPKKILNSGRTSVTSTVVTAKHRAGSVPK